jgi:hypothetical protein
MKEISRSIYALVLKDEWVPPLTTIERKRSNYIDIWNF